jgi:hypothetical protein
MPSVRSYATPVTWVGGWTNVYQRTRLDDSPQVIRIDYSPIGDTLVFGQVRYNSPDGMREEALASGGTIILGSGLGSWVQMRFTTRIILGTAVDIDITE